MVVAPAFTEKDLSNSGMEARVRRARGQLRDLLLECCHIELDRRGGIAGYRAVPGGCASCDARPVEVG